jgi:hypothetical protein
MGQGAKAPCLNMGRKQYTGQEMLTKLRLDTAVVDDVRIFQLMGPASKSPLLEKKYAVQTKDPDKLLTVDEMWRAYRRLVMCARRPASPVRPEVWERRWAVNTEAGRESR